MRNSKSKALTLLAALVLLRAADAKAVPALSSGIYRYPASASTCVAEAKQTLLDQGYQLSESSLKDGYFAFDTQKDLNTQVICLTNAGALMIIVAGGKGKTAATSLESLVGRMIPSIQDKRANSKQ
jgi:hypothetical protein